MKWVLTLYKPNSRDSKSYVFEMEQEEFKDTTIEDLARRLGIQAEYNMGYQYVIGRLMN